MLNTSADFGKKVSMYQRRSELLQIQLDDYRREVNAKRVTDAQDVAAKVTGDQERSEERNGKKMNEITRYVCDIRNSANSAYMELPEGTKEAADEIAELQQSLTDLLSIMAPQGQANVSSKAPSGPSRLYRSSAICQLPSANRCIPEGRLQG